MGQTLSFRGKIFFSTYNIAAKQGVLFFLLALFMGLSLSFGEAVAQSATTNKTGLPVPRFVSLKSERVNMRIGPGKQFKVVWLYLKKGLPIEIIQEYDNWRKVRDPEGSEGWILHSLLSGKRTTIVNPGEKGKESGIATMYKEASSEGDIIAKVEPGVIANLMSCQEQWCRVSANGTEGFLEKKYLWGVYPDELIEQ
ncbi:MAG: SH3 domain-containing protein [Rhizobiaceae bacterium]